GGNGGDAALAAAELRRGGREVELRCPLGRPLDGDALKAWHAAEAAGVPVAEGPLELHAGCGVVDGLFGIGIGRELDAKARAAVEAINDHARATLAIDVPSGLCADTGRMLPAAVRATRTVTFFARKLGLLMRHGPDCCGVLEVDGLGCELPLDEEFGAAVAGLPSIDALRRGSDSHKSSFGALAVVGGAPGMLGALQLATRAATAHGCGKVFAVPCDPAAPPADLLQPEIMWRAAPPADLDAAVVGVGMGESNEAKGMLAALLERDLAVLCDADALNMIAADEGLQELLRERAAATVLTPHPGEAARLLGCGADEVQADRLAAARRLAEAVDVWVALKGAGTVIAAPNGAWAVNSSGNAGLAQAGSGDVLAGVIGALLAQGVAPWDAAAGGVWLHGKGAELAAAEHGGCLGLSLAAVVRHSSRHLAWLASLRGIAA
ncbi:MAG: NAD(P)H-hydrate dehydratase, partial [Betaproteobacteria bacterium AqS2]|nr:NAD(P)H-hydrate dehydratase [Betaproteobacteria bacterium AqS2]